MQEAEVMDRVREIHERYVRTCAIADQINGANTATPPEPESSYTPYRSMCPELARFPSIALQQRALRSALRSPEVVRRLRWLKYVNWFAIVALTLPFLDSLLLLSAVAILAGVGLMLVEQRWILSGPIQAAVRQDLVDLGIPTCLMCGYDCRGTPHHPCPECGTVPRT